MMRHPKFKDEKVCPECNCNFLPGIKGQTHCLGCVPNPQFEMVKVDKEKRVINSSTGKMKSCKKCGVVFEYTHPAAKYCNECKKKK